MGRSYICNDLGIAARDGAAVPHVVQFDLG
jgi:hypothetical protein